MIPQSVRVAPSNSLVFISDPDGGQAPYPVRGAMILATDSCVSVRCYPETDGPTEIVLGDATEVEAGVAPAFDGGIVTPNGAVVVSSVGGDPLLRRDVAGERTRLRIWLSHPEWPEKVSIGLG